MSKILKNQTGSAILIGDVGIEIPASPATYTIQSTDDLVFAGSSALITHIGSGDIIVNDGTGDLDNSSGVDLIKEIFPKKIETFDGAYSRDSFGRFRISSINNFFESAHVNSEQTESWDYVTVGGGSKTYVSQKAKVDLAVGTASGDRAMRQTLNYFHYAAGQSMLIRTTGVLTSGKANVNICTGYYDDNNGMIFRVHDGVFQVGIRTDTTGVVIEKWVNQSSFNGDKLDGTGVSGITLNLDKTLIFEINFQWLGVGSVRYIIHIDGEAHVLHTFHHSNIETEVYMRTPHLPVRYEVINTGISASATTISQICTQVANEGKAIVGDLVDTVDNDTTTVSINSTTFKPILSMRAKTGNDILVQLESVGVMLTTADDILVKVYIDMTLTSPTWATHHDFIEKEVSATAATGGRHVGSFYISKSGNSVNSVFKDKFRLGKFIDGSKQIVTVVAKTLSNNASAVATISFKELF